MVTAALLGFCQPDLAQAAAAFAEGARALNAGVVVGDALGCDPGPGLAAALTLQTSFLPFFTQVKVLVELEMVFPAGEQFAPTFGAAPFAGAPLANSATDTAAAVMIPDACIPQRMWTPNLRLEKILRSFLFELNRYRIDAVAITGRCLWCIFKDVS
jgi:hypothetical protein